MVQPMPLPSQTELSAALLNIRIVLLVGASLLRLSWKRGGVHLLFDSTVYSNVDWHDVGIF